MIRNKDSKQKFILPLVVALIVHAAILAVAQSPLNDFELLSHLSEMTKNLKQPIKLENIKFIGRDEVKKFRKVGIVDGKKDLQRPDIVPKQKSLTTGQKGSPAALSLEKLAPMLPKPTLAKEAVKAPAKKMTNTEKNFLNIKPTAERGGNFYFNYKDNRVIPRSQEQEVLKTEATKNFTVPQNKATENISNFEIRYERPEGVSEDELNSDEKAYYSFYVRSYQNYYSKIYANYEKIVIERPALANAFDKKHLLIGKIDYDTSGNIVTVRILKSSDNDDLHYFFEETLKQLNQLNPPKIFTKNRKEFSIYYQLQIN